MKMPEKNPDLWSVVVAYVLQHSSFVCGVLVAFFASLSKSFLYGKKDTARRVIVEAFLCSLIAGSMRPLLTHFGLDIDLITPIGAALGLLGTSAIRQLILRFLKSKTGVVENEDQ